MTPMAPSRAIRALLTTLVILTTATTPALATPAHVVPIAKARALPLGTEVTVKGTATTPSGAFESSFFDKGFGIQDASAGIYVSVPTDLHVIPGRQARVTGVLRDSFGLRILVPAADSDVTLGHTGFPVPPKWTATTSMRCAPMDLTTSKSWRPW